MNNLKIGMRLGTGFAFALVMMSFIAALGARAAAYRSR